MQANRTSASTEDRTSSLSFSERSLYLGLLLSLFLHLVAFLFLRALPELAVLSLTQKKQPPENIELTLIENPENRSKPDPDTRFVSREESRAAGRLTDRFGLNELFPRQTGRQPIVQPSDSGYGPSEDSTVFEETETGLKLPEHFDFNQERAFRVDSSGGLSFDTKKYEDADYYLRLVQKISRQWHKAIPLTAHYMGLIPNGEVRIILLIARDGTLLEHKVARDFHYPSMTRAAEFAVTTAAPFEPLPDSIREEAAAIPIIFRYVTR